MNDFNDKAWPLEADDDNAAKNYVRIITFFWYSTLRTLFFILLPILNKNC